MRLPRFRIKTLMVIVAIVGLTAAEVRERFAVDVPAGPLKKAEEHFGSRSSEA